MQEEQIHQGIMKSFLLALFPQWYNKISQNDASFLTNFTRCFVLYFSQRVATGGNRNCLIITLGWCTGGGLNSVAGIGGSAFSAATASANCTCCIWLLSSSWVLMIFSEIIFI